MALPMLPLIKIIALGSLKIVFLLLGALFFPVTALRAILTGASGMLLPVLDWLEDNDRLEQDRHRAVVDDLEALSHVEFTRVEARHLLFGLTRKTVKNMGGAILGIPAVIGGYIGRLFGLVSR